jgi:hypothetical protein
MSFVIAIESSALAEKLLNDLLKTTEGFQKLKKINEGLQSQVSNDTLYVRNIYFLKSNYIVRTIEERE